MMEAHHREDCEENKLLEHPDDCSKMLVCTSNKLALVQKCNRDFVTNTQLFFSEENQWCDYLENVDCGSRNISPHDTHMIQVIKMEKPAKTMAPDCSHKDCVGVDGKALVGDYWLPMAECDRCVCRCHRGLAKRICCRQGIIWSQERETCDWKHNVPGCGTKL
jgi:hypothetical protein